MDYFDEGYVKERRGLFVRSLAHRATSALRHFLLETELFVGIALLAVGLLSFESDKYCDGNTADYLSCTRPSTYYYFDWLDVTLIVLGLFFIVIWSLNRNERRS